MALKSAMTCEIACRTARPAVRVHLMPGFAERTHVPARGDRSRRRIAVRRCGESRDQETVSQSCPPWRVALERPGLARNDRADERSLNLHGVSVEAAMDLDGGEWLSSGCFVDPRTESPCWHAPLARRPGTHRAENIGLSTPVPGRRVCWRSRGSLSPQALRGSAECLWAFPRLRSNVDPVAGRFL